MGINIAEKEQSELSLYENYGHGQDGRSPVDESATVDLKINFKNVNTFDKRLIRKLVDEDLINKKHLRDAISSDKKAAKPIFNIQNESDQ